MCGINGIYNYSSVHMDEPQELVRRMNAVVQHRGPDDTGVWSGQDNRIVLGHQRLSILDLSENGHQPMTGERGATIVFNGEIYNFRSLRETLGDYRFISESDTEVLLAMYEKDGKDCLQSLNGMFAFSIWDSREKKLFLARDRIGIKPLYYTSVNGVFSFSSEIKSLLTLPWVKAELDERALYNYLTFNRVEPPQTMFRDIYKLHPGHMMVVGSGGIERNEPYWEVEYDNYEGLAEQDIRELILQGLERSVTDRMVSDVPVGAFLSGGVDSSAIVALMSRQQTSPVKTYSIGFSNSPGFDERQHAGLIAEKYNTEHYEKTVSPQDITDFLPEVVNIYDEPLADATSIPMYFISQLARENKTTVVLTGDGADELFCGYRSWMRYVKAYPYYRFLMKLPEVLRCTAASTYGRFGSESVLQEILSRACHRQELFWGGAGGFKESTKRKFLSPEYSKRMLTASSYQTIERYRASFNEIHDKSREGKDVDWMMYLGLKYIVPNFYLYRADRMGMAHSIELRVPFLDHSFVNMVLSLPSGWKTQGGEPKYILKKSLEDILPQETLYRKKQGFCVPLQEWAGDIMLHYIEENLAVFCRDTGLFDDQNMRTQIMATRAGKQDYIHTLWNFYFLMIWFRKWLI